MKIALFTKQTIDGITAYLWQQIPADRQEAVDAAIKYNVKAIETGYHTIEDISQPEVEKIIRASYSVNGWKEVTDEKEKKHTAPLLRPELLSLALHLGEVQIFPQGLVEKPYWA